jgi:hypothetical protein
LDVHDVNVVRQLFPIPLMASKSAQWAVIGTGDRDYRTKTKSTAKRRKPVELRLSIFAQAGT